MKHSVDGSVVVFANASTPEARNAALDFARRGWFVVLAGASDTTLNELKKYIHMTGGVAHVVPANPKTPDDLARGSPQETLCSHCLQMVEYFLGNASQSFSVGLDAGNGMPGSQETCGDTRAHQSESDDAEWDPFRDIPEGSVSGLWLRITPDCHVLSSLPAAPAPFHDRQYAVNASSPGRFSLS